MPHRMGPESFPPRRTPSSVPQSREPHVRLLSSVPPAPPSPPSSIPWILGQCPVAPGVSWQCLGSS
eukprot:5699120-Alexandrium_andersonii.AAC.1